MTAEPLPAPELREMPGQMLRWQWHAIQPWYDEEIWKIHRVREATSYLAGFETKAAAERYGEIMKGTGRW